MVKNLKMFFSNRDAAAIGLVFMTVSILFGSWVTRIPDMKSNLNLNEGTLGLSLLGMSIGALIMMPFSAWIMSKVGTGKTMFFGIIIATLTMALPAFATSFWTLVMFLFVAGLFHGLTDVAMNAAAATIEQSQRIRILSTCHGMFSLGGMFGAILGSLLAGYGVSVQIHLMSLSIIMVIVILLISKSLLNVEDAEIEEGKLFVIPSGALIGLAIVGFIIMMGEGAIADWSAIFIKDYLNGTAAVAGLGFAGFSLTMAFGRFIGDSIIPKYGSRNIIQVGSALGVIGLALVIFIPNIYVAILGFAIVGLGFSCVVPILFSAAAKVPGIASGTGIAAVTTSGIFGFLIGPPSIGFIANELGLTLALGCVMILAGLAVVLSSQIKLNE
ncbi:MAG: MFS family permease [Cognaticolwellia sp.]|jgi:MFS family permease|tara:strand:- start:787 stop:1941 length:1155 start_codon:yes stop_codon:yes gene_type:complete